MTHIGWRRVPELARDTVYEVYFEADAMRARSHSKGFGFLLDTFEDGATVWPQEGDTVYSGGSLGMVTRVEDGELTTQYVVAFGGVLMDLTAAELQPEGWV